MVTLCRLDASVVEAHLGEVDRLAIRVLELAVLSGEEPGQTDLLALSEFVPVLEPGLELLVHLSAVFQEEGARYGHALAAPEHLGHGYVVEFCNCH